MTVGCLARLVGYRSVVKSLYTNYLRPIGRAVVDPKTVVDDVYRTHGIDGLRQMVAAASAILGEPAATPEPDPVIQPRIKPAAKPEPANRGRKL